LVLDEVLDFLVAMSNTGLLVRHKQRNRARLLICVLLRYARATLGILWLRSLARHYQWHRGMWSMCLRSMFVNVRRLFGWKTSYTVEIRQHLQNGEEYAIWWPARDCTASIVPTRRRLWVLVPGGLSDGDSVAGYFDDLLRSDAIDCTTEDYCIFHNAGTGGAKWRTTAFAGLSNPCYLLDFLMQLGVVKGTSACAPPHSYTEIVVLGFSVGGMLTLSAAERLLGRGASQGVDDCTCFLRFVAVHSPDHLRLTFEAMMQSSWFARIDVPLAIHFWLVCWRSGLRRKCPKAPQWPLPPTWQHIRQFTEASWAQNEIIKRKASGRCVEGDHSRVDFETFDHEFSFALRSPMPRGCVLRIQNPDDPVVDSSTLDEQGLTNCELWWVRAGGHTMCFGACNELGRRLRKWIDTPFGEADSDGSHVGSDRANQ